ncbi:MAG TPA: glucose-6-phosphate dehydrogenase [Flavitalea sp.]|nr:glucose-6-phosphate dehydrogenase [Flavitalea sp.]
MSDIIVLPPALLFIFGGSGDLSYRKLVPALYNLYLDERMPGQFEVIGLGRSAFSDEQYRAHLLPGITSFSRQPNKEDDRWESFGAHLHFLSMDFQDAATYALIADYISKKQTEFSTTFSVIFYLAVAPQLVPVIVEHLKVVPCCMARRQTRIVVEKPFGSDLDSARRLNRQLGELFTEEQIFRIDHYLGKETVQNILAFRFANVLFEPVWNKNYIDHIQITAAETVGMEKRGEYYEHSGALRDMVQNHLLQLVCMIAMEPPLSFDANEIRNKKSDVLKAIRRINEDGVDDVAARGQYAEAKINAEHVAAYRNEENVSPASAVETFAALKLFVDNWRWQDVPFYLRTGKRMNTKTTVISVVFKAPPEYSFPAALTEKRMPNRITFSIQPEADIRLRFQAKKPGSTMQLNPVNMVFTYKDAFSETPEAYETLLLDIMENDATLFMRTDQVEEAWKVIMPVLQHWQQTAPDNFPDYSPGSWGPSSGNSMIEKDNRRWVTLPLPLKEENIL